jgi:hypothetical protein
LNIAVFGSKNGSRRDSAHRCHFRREMRRLTSLRIKAAAGAFPPLPPEPIKITDIFRFSDYYAQSSAQTILIVLAALAAPLHRSPAHASTLLPAG